MMKKMCSQCNKNIGLLVLRLGLGSIFVLHGVLKLMYIGTTISFFGQLGFSPIWAWVVALVEVVAGVMILIGFFTRIAGALLAIVMIVAFLKVKLPLGGMQAFMAGEIDIALFILSVGLMCTGSGKYSVTAFCKCGGTCMVCKENTCKTCMTSCCTHGEPATPKSE